MKVFLGVLALFSIHSNASSIKDHKAISYEGVLQFERCVGRRLTTFARENFILSNLEEDINLPRKWLIYSHYYNPYKNVSTWRGTSMHRMWDSQDSIVAWKKNLKENSNTLGVQLALSELGHLVHHVQDSAVPSHVVPVKHGLSDGFESYKGEATRIELNCSDVAVMKDPTAQLHESALQTLSSLEDPFEARFRGLARNLNWKYFWSDTGAKFGSYGFLGNRFGQTKIQTPSGTFEISSSTYHNFWLERRTQAIQRTSQLLYWFFSNLITEKGQSQIRMSDGKEISLEELLFEP